MNTDHGMVTELMFLNTLPFYYEGENEGEGGEGDSGGEGVGETGGESGGTGDTKGNDTKKVDITQDRLNHLLREERRKTLEQAKKANEKTIKQLEELRKTVGLTEEEKNKLAQRIEDIRDEYLTKEQMEKKKQKEEAERSKKEREEIFKERDRWRDLYQQSTIDRELLDAGIRGDAFNAEQVVILLRPNTRLIEELDPETNQPTGRFVPKVRLAGKDKDGKSVVLDLTPTDAVKQMKEMKDIYGNLFNSGAHSGVGGNNNASYNKGTNSPPLNDPAAYRRWREQQKKAGIWT